MIEATGLEAVGRSLASNVLEANLEALRVPERSRRAVLEASRRGEPVRLPDGSPAVRIGGRIVGAPSDEASLRSCLASLDDPSTGVAVVFGYGAGHAPRSLRERTTARLVVYEPDPGLLRAVLEAGPTDLGGIPVVCDLLDLQTLWPSLAGHKPRSSLIHTPGYEAAFPEAAAALAETVRALVADVSLMESTRIMRFRTWIEDLLENIDWLAETSTSLALAGRFAGVPAFIVGAGPSLARNVQHLAAAAEKGIVLAVDVSGRVLDKNGIEPQILVCLEALNLSKDLDSLSFIDRCVRAFSLSASPVSLRTGSGPLLPFFESLPPFKPLSELLGASGLAVGGSVSTVAFSLAERLGCSPIVMVGQDLAYTDGRTHAEGTVFERSRVRVDRASGIVAYDWCEAAEDVRRGSDLGPAQRREALFEVDAWGGAGSVASTSAFNAYRAWFANAAETLARLRPDLRVVNATEGGSHIRGFEERRLGDVVSELPSRGISSADVAAMAHAAQPPQSRAHLARWLQKQAVLTALARRAAARVRRAAERALACIEAQEPGAVSEAFRDVEVAEQRLRAALARQPLLEAWAYRDLHGIAARPTCSTQDSDSRSDAEWGLRAELALADVVVSSASDLEARLRTAARRSRTATNRLPSSSTLTLGKQPCRS